MSSQLDQWTGQFGREYTDRNVPDWHQRIQTFQDILGDVHVESVLEVGCNRGHNLRVMQHLYPEAVVQGVEPMDYARRLAQTDGHQVLDGTAYELPFPDDTFDLVFTSGVLIHVPPERLHEAMLEIARVSGRYVLAVEYHADRDTEIDYRGNSDMLWKRDYAKHYQAATSLELVATGEAGIDNAQWVLLAKDDQ